MKDRIYSVYEKYIKPVFKKFGDIVENLKSRFKTAVDNIQKKWDKLKGIAADPVKFVIKDIYNIGLIKTLNKVTGDNMSNILDAVWINQYAIDEHRGSARYSTN